MEETTRTICCIVVDNKLMNVREIHHTLDRFKDDSIANYMSILNVRGCGHEAGRVTAIEAEEANV